MAAEVENMPAQIDTFLNYYLTPEHGGLTITYPGTAGDKVRKHDSHPVKIQDLRPCHSKEAFTLDRNGFQLVSHECAERLFEDPEKVKTVAYQETADLLRKVTGASKVHVFSHIIRRHKWDDAIKASKEAKGEMDIVPLMNPAMFCHVDQSYKGAEQVLRDNCSAEDTARLSKTRWGIINVWRPIGSRPISREPLAVCDWRSLSESDLRPVSVRLPSKGTGTFEDVSVGEGFETWNLVANPEHKWYYGSKMSPDEALMIKCFDSKKDGTARCAPHSAFRSPFDTGGARESCEVRCLVFWEDQSVE